MLLYKVLQFLHVFLHYDLTLAPFQVVKREVSGARVNLDCLRLNPKRYCIIAPAGYSTDDYETALSTARDYGALCDSDGLFPGGDDGYRIW